MFRFRKNKATSRSGPTARDTAQSPRELEAQAGTAPTTDGPTPEDASRAVESDPRVSTPRISTKLCTPKYNGRYPTVGLYDTRSREAWFCKPRDGQAIRTSHAALITGVDDATGTVWKDRFLCFWFYTPNTGSGLILGYPIDWDEAHLLVRVDPQWDYDRQRAIPPELSDQIEANLERQMKHGERVANIIRDARPGYTFHVHYVASRAADSMFYARRVTPA